MPGQIVSLLCGYVSFLAMLMNCALVGYICVLFLERLLAMNRL